MWLNVLHHSIEINYASVLLNLIEISLRNVLKA